MKKPIVVFKVASFVFFALWMMALPLFAKKPSPSQSAPFQNSKEEYFYASQLVFQGQWSAAQEVLNHISLQKLSEDYAARVQFLQGYTALKTKEAKKAAAIFQKLTSVSFLKKILPFYFAQSLRLSGDPAAALSVFKEFCGENCETKPQISGRFLVEYAAARCAAGQTDPARMIFDALISSPHKLSSPEKGVAHVALAECLQRAGQPDLALSELKTLYTDAFPSILRVDLEDALNRLHQAFPAVPESFSLIDHQKRLATLKNQERFTQAALELASLKQKNILPFSEEESAELFFKARSYQASAELYKKLAKQTSDPILKKEFIEKLASSYARSNQFTEAIRTQELLESEYGVDPLITRYKIIFLNADAGNFEAAVQTADRYLADFPKSAKTKAAVWLKAWALYRSQKFASAIEVLKLAQSFGPEESSRARYWAYQAAQKGRLPNLKSLKEEFLKQPDPFWRALEERGLEKNCPVVAAENAYPREAEELIARLRIDFGTESEQLSESLRLGLFEDFWEVYSGLENLRVSVLEWTRFFATLEKIPTDLMKGLIQQESRFDPNARSPVGALGLMQLMPQTAFDTAESLGFVKVSESGLLHSILNLRLGSRYLASLLEQFSGNAVFATASYNGGPDAVMRWRKQHAGLSCNEFIEQIPFSETKNYVKKVLLNDWAAHSSR